MFYEKGQFVDDRGIVFGSNFPNRDFDEFTHFEVV